MKQQLKELGERIINDNYAMIGYADDPEWLKKHLWMFQDYNPGLFHEQLKGILQQKLTNTFCSNMSINFNIDIASIIKLFKDYNNNTQVKKIDNLYNFQTYSYSYKDKIYKIPIKLIFQGYLQKDIPGSNYFKINVAYCKENNILFVQIQKKLRFICS